MADEIHVNLYFCIS